MACASCSTKDGSPKGCKNNGTCGTDSCNKLTVFDWLANMSLPNGETPFDWVEVRYKNGRKDYYKNTENLTLSIGDIVATQAQAGHDIGMVTLTGELVRVQMKRKNVSPEGDDVLKIYRKATQKDIDIWQKSRDKEEPMKVKARQFAIDLKLQMKISDIEFQGDGSKATFYYTAEERVDFRELIKVFAREFRTRIEMRQVGFRQEASRLGGIGSCGRELCCSTWLTDFRSVSTSAARYQQLSLNPQKLAGQCGKLKCCLNYELDAYLDALKEFPKTDIKLKTEKGIAVCQKTDIFKGHMWYAYEGEWMNWHKITVQQANEIIELNTQNKPVTSLEEYALDLAEDTKVEFENVVGQDSLTRFDSPKRHKKRRNNRRKGNQANKNNQGNRKQTSNNNTNQNKKRRNNKKKPQNAKNNQK
ncbi:Cell fate regulator YaaT, PSP1 superfamily (controls sporulation, competence, biofilm development) [Hyunsoonleella jejuensis]|uniref:Cell fate regulator YaaT, PSP1 superfamily (Controls sporulation, competence, biofilm development) n=1 Tax=Hyunsoonleella jejuensis TaxID=419940 RepID=A0A1H9AHA5_9FLAO|nr:regulatory iron-sulfur-containing complex subunit RicT [Hyunsoonleella jejuensis]SEP75861.1 Cell fate regulator YaaT, PSP1 superfamily (controls sporulation, competence, biofilm development) [Hyunsoonleella jejuensis]